jgi:RNA polymerase sigma-70 factor, ECF subfamily
MLESDTLEDSALMLQVAKGDKNALGFLVDRWARPLSGFIYRYVQDKDAVGELVQETFIRLYGARDRFDSSKKFSSWLFKIASNLCKNYCRWKKRHPENLVWDESCESVIGSGLPTYDDDPSQSLVVEEDMMLLKRAVDSMPHVLKTALILYYYQDMSYKEVAEAIGCTERGVETKLYRARAYITNYFETKGESRFDRFIKKIGIPARA